MKLGLGTVQFGLDYGVSNTTGKTPLPEVGRILEAAVCLGVRVIDTAAGYGTSEEALGKSWPEPNDFEVVTKIPGPGPENTGLDAPRRAERAFLRSLRDMKRTSCYGLLVHHPGELAGKEGKLLWSRLEDLKSRGMVRKIGVSVYTGEQIDAVRARFPVELVQVPVNVLDQRLIASGHLEKMKGWDVEVHARSVFLQGLLLMDPDAMPPFFRSVRERIRAFHRASGALGVSTVHAAVGFVLGLPWVDAVICGVNDRRQLEEIYEGAHPLPGELFSEFACREETVLNPSAWRP